MEGNSSTLDGHYLTRENPIQKCYNLARSLGYTIFSIQDGGYCSTSDVAVSTYDMYGTSSECKNDGKGGPLANEVYVIGTG